MHLWELQLRARPPPAPTHVHAWFGQKLGTRGTSDVGNPLYHHNLARGTCRCPNSDSGASYMDRMYDHSGGELYSHCNEGAMGGLPYQGPRKCNAQIKLEARLVELSEEGKEETRACGKQGCSQPGIKRCARCR